MHKDAGRLNRLHLCLHRVVTACFKLDGQLMRDPFHSIEQHYAKKAAPAGCDLLLINVDLVP